ncbi:hypothetical protein EYF80_042102 [Liparis tanakae]|uniref:Uncharacterized protein n=1 Tax=Liparis tanakae TaxID=230148 RepID=A0A4Z2G532_9TELE|nr:hypothetical protein EYF80_042102 [Liparis tanakae]
MPGAGARRDGPSVVAMRAGLELLALRTASAPCAPHAAVPQVVVVVVVVLVVVPRHLMDRHRPLPGALPPPPLAALGLRWRRRGGDVEAGASGQQPAHAGRLPGALVDHVHQVLEQLVVAGARLGQRGQGAGVGHEADPLLLHQLTLPLLGLRELRGDDHQAQNSELSVHCRPPSSYTLGTEPQSLMPLPPGSEQMKGFSSSFLVW